jgi:hypothetical protein
MKHKSEMFIQILNFKTMVEKEKKNEHKMFKV